MRCSCCDRLLNDSESTAKFVNSGNYVDMCKKCTDTLPEDIEISRRRDLDPRETMDDDYSDPFDLGDNDDEGW